jgi:hypothetical protein
MVEEWMSSKGGEAGWMAATNALGLGVDDPNVQLDYGDECVRVRHR